MHLKLCGNHAAKNPVCLSAEQRFSAAPTCERFGAALLYIIIIDINRLSAKGIDRKYGTEDAFALC